MQITFNLPQVFAPNSPSDQNADALRVLLDALIRLNLSFLRHNPGTPALYASGVVYGRTSIWDTIPALYERRYGDCKTLTAALIAEYRLQGIECQPVFRWVRRPDASGALDFHILVQTSRGFEDPSKVLGMGKNENARQTRQD